MRIFVTGATGFIGSAIVKDLIGAGHRVLGLARSEAGAAALRAAGADAHRGQLDDLESLRTGAAASDGVIHTAFIHGIGQANLRTRLRIIAGIRKGMVASFMGTIVAIDKQAVETLGAALAGSDRPLVVTSGTMMLTPGRLGTENDPYDPTFPGRGPTEDATVALASRGVRASIVRLAPTVHGDGDHGFIPQIIATARKTGVSAYVGDGRNHWPAVHRLDAARLFRLAAERGNAGSIFHGAAEEGVPFREIAETIGRRLNVPVVEKTGADAVKHFGWLGMFVGIDNRASSDLTRERLGWQPTGPELLSDLANGTYFDKYETSSRRTTAVSSA